MPRLTSRPRARIQSTQCVAPEPTSNSENLPSPPLPPVGPFNPSPPPPPPPSCPPPLPSQPQVGERRPFGDPLVPPFSPLSHPIDPIAGGQHGFTGPAASPYIHPGGHPYYPFLYPVFRHPPQQHSGMTWSHTDHPMVQPPTPVPHQVATPLQAPTGTQGHLGGNTENGLAPLFNRPGRRYPNTQLSEGGEYSPSIYMGLDTDVD